jgi:hypothetical protein
MKTVQCPSCGAYATNLKNCEFCNSLFVRFIDKNVDSTGLFDTDLSFNGFIFPGLESELQKNLSLQKLSSVIITDIWCGDVSMQIGQTTTCYDSTIFPNRSFPSIAIDFPFTTDRQSEYTRFISLPESKLFHSYYDNVNDINVFAIDFGKDAKGAAYLSSIILMKLYGLNESSMLKFSTTDYNYTPDKSEEKSNCFIATATMGDFNDPTVVELRGFRDNWLIKKSWGLIFVKYYYLYGSKVAKIIEKSKTLRVFSFIFIVKPLYFIVKIMGSHLRKF